MPGLVNVELVEQGDDFVIIKTNEGLIKRTNISKPIETESVVVEYDEEYQAGSKINVKTHYRKEFMTISLGVKHHLVMSDFKAPGFLGFFYRKFDKSSTGNALLKAYKTYFENQND
jgi:hypothetical protein